jgi:DMSO/TMAO reductase YedYZ molybdopterin-dependent catalytic subunit
VPVNKTARAARVETLAHEPTWRLTVTGPTPLRLSLADLSALPQHTESLPITCVEGWSADARWSGVRLRDLVERVGADPGRVRVLAISLQEGAYSIVATPHVRDPLTLVALRLNGEPLHLDHGFPCRLIAPNRPGVMQTKWLGELTVEPT